MDEEIRVQFDHQGEFDSSISSELAERGLRLEREGVTSHALDPASVAIIVGGIMVLGTFIAGLIERWRGGTIIDISGSETIVRRSKDLPLGIFLIVASDGEVKIEARDLPKDALERFVTKIIEEGSKLVIDGIKDIAGSILPVYGSS